jgi:hypothetical protein
MWMVTLRQTERFAVFDVVESCANFDIEPEIALVSCPNHSMRSNRRRRVYWNYRLKEDDEGCKWHGPVGELSVHLLSCEHELVCCPHNGNCTQHTYVHKITNNCIPCQLTCPFSEHPASIMIKNLYDHIQSCNHKYRTCEFCNSEHVLLYHFKHCPEFEVECELECGLLFRRSQQFNHPALCTEVRISCPYIQFCKTFTKRSLIENHLIECEPLWRDKIDEIANAPGMVEDLSDAIDKGVQLFSIPDY